MDIRVQIHTSYPQAWESNRFSKAQAPLQQVCHQLRVRGKREEGMGESGDSLELDCMDLQPANKNPSLISHEISEWSLHQPTWKGIQLPLNWFTSRESEHSLFNGQSKALQNSKGQLKMIKIYSHTS